MKVTARQCQGKHLLQHTNGLVARHEGIHKVEKALPIPYSVGGLLGPYHVRLPKYYLQLYKPQGVHVTGSGAHLTSSGMRAQVGARPREQRQLSCPTKHMYLGCTVVGQLGSALPRHKHNVLRLDVVVANHH